MISFIICSGKSDLAEFKRNISNSVGLKHEFIIISNPNARYSIAQAYNQGIRNSKYPYLCFIHDDVKILTDNWGPKIINQFENDPTIGLAGLIGTQYKSVFPTPWTCPDISYNKGTVWQFSKRGKEPFLLQYSKSIDSEQVAVVDGMFLFTKSNYIKDVGYFDERLSGFHCYDIDLALRNIIHNKKVIVYPKILVEHHSEGKLNDDWFKNQLYLMKKWRSLLPVNIRTQSIDYELERMSFKRSLYVFLKNNMSIRTRLNYLIFYLTFNRIPLKNYLIILFSNISSLLMSKVSKN